MCACSTNSSKNSNFYNSHILRRGVTLAPFYPPGGALSPPVCALHETKGQELQLVHRRHRADGCTSERSGPFDHHVGEPPSCPQDPHGHVMETNPPRIGCAPTSSRLDGDQGVCRPWALHQGFVPGDEQLEKSALPCAIPSTRRACHSPSGHPRPTVRRLDAVSVPALKLDHCFATGGRPRERPWIRLYFLSQSNCTYRGIWPLWLKWLLEGVPVKSMSAKDAKNGFGRLLDTARAEPVTIKKHGRAVVVVMSVEEYLRLTQAAQSRKHGISTEDGRTSR